MLTVAQKQICRELIKLSIEHGFGSNYPLAPIAAKLGIAEPLYDNNTKSGILWELGPHGGGLLFIPHSGDCASVEYDTHEMLANWCHPKSVPCG